MRWDYDQPHPKLFLTDGQTAWFYVPGEHDFNLDDGAEYKKRFSKGTVGNGWYSGHIGNGGFQAWGKIPALLAQLEVTYADGSVDRGRFEEAHHR